MTTGWRQPFFEGLGPDAFNNLYINGILQESGSYGVSDSALTFSPAGGTIYAGTPIILETVRLSAQVTY
ncbi:DUF4183 domain-containing protein [Paenibacillus sp. P25]|nr:DUF4183 domain-containing protein [Paenibacillus sp. P25]